MFPQEFFQSVYTQLSVANTRSVNADAAAVEYYYHSVYKRFHASAGVQVAEKQNALWLRTGYDFYVNNGKSLGAILDAEFEKYDDISFRSHLSAGLSWNVYFERTDICIFGEVMFGRKSSRLIGFDDIDPLVTWNPVLNTTVAWNVNYDLTLYLSLKSSEEFYRPGFFAPIISTAATYRIAERTRVTGYVGIRGLDLCILSSYVDSFVFKIGLGVDL